MGCLETGLPRATSLRSDWSKNDFARSKFFDCRGTSVFGTGTCTSSGIITIKICDIILRPLSLFVRATKRTTGHLVTMVCTCFNGCWDDGSLHDCDTRLRTHQYRLAVIRLARAHRLARRFFSRVAMSAAAARVIAPAACAGGLASAASARAAGPAGRSSVRHGADVRLASRCASLTRAVYRHVEAVGDGRDATSYEVYPVAGDGRCLFRSVAAATAIRADGARLSPDVETAEADRLRNLAVDQLRRRRAEVEWFIEGDFDAYCDAMRRPIAWGGEPEILMLTHVLESPVEVFMPSPDARTVRSIGAYGAD